MSRRCRSPALGRTHFLSATLDAFSRKCLRVCLTRGDSAPLPLRKLRSFLFEFLSIQNHSMSHSKKELLQDISEVCSASLEQVGYHRKQMEQFSTFVQRLRVLVENEAPDFVGKYDEISEQITEAQNSEMRLVDAEERLAEDLNDVGARFEVIFRISSEVGEARTKLREARAKITKLRQALEDDNAKGGQKKYKIEAEIKAAIGAKQIALEH